MIYLIIFACYGCHLHGSEYGSVDRNHNIVGTPYMSSGPALAQFEMSLMQQPPYQLDSPRRAAVLAAVVEACECLSWTLLAVHVRSNHVHIVVDAQLPPERVMLTFKTYASRRLNITGMDALGRKRWGRHGSTRWLKNSEEVSAAVKYVIEEQGRPMDLWQA
ncbi:MAG: transposase [Acidobacteria bacterium]|nr:transposase [Acidobacteriota bacterium]